MNVLTDCLVDDGWNYNGSDSSSSFVLTYVELLLSGMVMCVLKDFLIQKKGIKTLSCRMEVQEWQTQIKRDSRTAKGKNLNWWKGKANWLVHGNGSCKAVWEGPKSIQMIKKLNEVRRGNISACIVVLDGDTSKAKRQIYRHLTPLTNELPAALWWKRMTSANVLAITCQQNISATYFRTDTDAF